jgi:hypothetical protein
MKQNISVITCFISWALYASIKKRGFLEIVLSIFDYRIQE